MNVASPQATVRMGACALKGEMASLLAVKGSCVYVLDSYVWKQAPEIRAVDVSDPEHPVEGDVVKEFNDLGSKFQIYQSSSADQDSLLYAITSGSKIIRRYNLSDPLHPRELSEWHVHRGLEPFLVEQPYLFWGAGQSVGVLKVSPSDSCQETGHCSARSWSSSLQYADGYLYDAEGTCFQIFDVSNVIADGKLQR